MRKPFSYHLIRNKYFIYSFFALITLATLLLTLMPSDNVGSSDLFQYDKIGHFLLFYFWTISFGLLMMIKKPTSLNIFIVMIVGSVFGIAVEVIQFLMPFGRNMDIMDALADILGSIFAGLTLFFLNNRYKEEINS